jgi:hypothetical protein
MASEASPKSPLGTHLSCGMSFGFPPESAFIFNLEYALTGGPFNDVQLFPIRFRTSLRPTAKLSVLSGCLCLRFRLD